MSEHSLIRDELPYGPEIEPGVMLLHRPPARHSRVQRQHAFATMWDITPFNIDLADDDTADALARRWAGLVRSLGAGSILDVRLDSSPGHAVPAWERSRQGLEGTHLDWQRHHIASGMPHVLEGRSYRLRENRFTIGLRIPGKILLNPGLMDYLMTACVWRSRRVQHYFDVQIAQHMDAELKHFLGRIESFQIALDDIGLKPVLLTGDALLSRLAKQLDPESPAYACEPGVPLRDQLGTQTLRLDHEGCRIGKRRASVLEPHRGIAQTFPGILSAPRAPEGDRLTLDLSSMIGERHASISVVTTIPPRGEMINRLQSRQSFAWVQRLGGRGEVRADVDAQEKELSELIALATSQQDALLPTAVRVIAWDPDEIPTNAYSISDRLLMLGISAERETLVGNTLFLQSLSCGTDIDYPSNGAIGGMPFIPGVHTAKLMPIWGGIRGPGESSANGVLFLNRLGEPVLFDPFDLPGSPHGIVIGLTRSGKSALVNTLLHQTLPTGARAFILDRYCSYEKLCEIHGGIHFTMDIENPICLGLMDGPLDAAHRATIHAAMTEMCGATEEQKTLSGRDSAILRVLIKKWARDLSPDSPKTLSHFVDSMDQFAPEIHPDAEALCADLKMLLMPYYGDGEYAGFIDGPNELEVGDQQLVAVDIAALREIKEIEAVMVALFFMRFGDIVRDPAHRNTPKFMIADEVAFLLESPSTAKFFVTLSRALARFTCSLITITQLLRDFDNPVGDTIAGMAGFRMIFRLPPREQATITKDGLGAKHSELILNLERSHSAATCYMSTKLGDEGVIRIVAPPEFIQAIGQDPVHRLAREEQEMAALEAE